MKPLLKFLIFCMGASFLQAAPNAVISTSFGDGSVKTSSVKLEKRADGAYRLRLPAADIPANAVNMDVHYSLARAQKGEAGYWITPDGCRGSFSQDNGVYNPRPVMPIFGMQTPRGTFVAIVKGLKYEYITFVLAKNGVYKMFPRFQIKEMYFAPYEDIIIDFYNFPPSATYVDMAKKYRQYQLERGEVKPLKERVKTNKHLAYAARSMFLKLSMAGKDNRALIEHQTPANEPPLHVLCTFDDSIELMKKLKAASIDNVQICYTGWILKGHDGRALQFFPVEEAVGGEAKMRQAVALGKSLGYQMTCHVAYTGAFTISNRWDDEYIAKLPDGSLWSKSIWAGGRSYQPCMKRVLELFVDEDYAHLRDIGIEGIFHLDVNSAIRPPFCCDPRHPQTRQQGADAMNAMHEKSREYFGGQGSEAGFDHVARTLDFALYTSVFYKYRPRSKLVEDCVPLWQVAYHGIILSNPFLTSMYHLIAKEPDYLKGRLQLAEYGGRPVVYTGIKNIERNFARIKKCYEEFERYAHLQLEFIDGHKKLAEGVFETTYSNGARTVVNYTSAPFKYRDTEIPSRDYKIFE